MACLGWGAQHWNLSRPHGRSRDVRGTRSVGHIPGDVYGIAVTFEAVGIIAAVWLLRRFALSHFLLPVVGFIVRLHFLGMWQATHLLNFAWLAVAMCFVCGLAIFLPGNEDTDARRIVAGLGSAVVLWAAGVATLF